MVMGTTQPGEWHIYTAVYHQEDSELYVDGKREGWDPNQMDENADVGIGVLDGLTLGTDHRNDFPLGGLVDGASLTPLFPSFSPLPPPN